MTTTTKKNIYSEVKSFQIIKDKDYFKSVMKTMHITRSQYFLNINAALIEICLLCMKQI